ncbi:MAG: hypothetical protein HYY90_04340 [Candidatus Omnitrophica bacterium]|nr:hypothetical protein [Candidatus Omnitrophota bacterium]MBI2495909.1 hypothetical protein [Candidatus Omnitrophota bacterium]MBI3021940.1 hypothetical protein [Candidatus Omnitrophota bacterium]MBI3083573.1 hypothetical protein [Candidatus Omnitrophota bacterium]
MAPRRSGVSLEPLIIATLGGALAAGLIAWQLNLRAMDRHINATRSTLKKLVLPGGIPPDQRVMEYLSARHASIEQRYRSLLTAAAVPPLAESAAADPQLYFQEQLHEVQRMLERLAAARAMPVPEQLGFPKALPPSDTVPRLLMQLSLVKELATLVFGQGVIGVSSVKLEDPEAVADEREVGVFLTRLPVRIRFTSSLPQFLHIVVAIAEREPLIDIRGLRIVSGEVPDRLDVELALARYLPAASTSR